MAQRELTFITGNAGKVAELQELLDPLGIKVRQHDAGYPEIQASTLEEVAASGAQSLLDAGVEPPFVLEDAGLFVSALNGFPGVYSANAQATIGNAGLLRLMNDVELELRTAAFQACLTHVDEDGRITHHHGTCKGRIADWAAGDQGFGFDPIFIPDGDERTFAQMSSDEKSKMSHRGMAARALVEFLGQ